MTLLVVVTVAVVFLAVSLFLTWKLSNKEEVWSLPGAKLDANYPLKGRSKEGFTGNKACMLLKNRGKRLPITVKRAKAGPKDVYEGEKCGAGALPGTGGRNAPLGFAQDSPCETDLVLKPGESCSLGLRLVAEGSPDGELDLSTEVVCPSRDIPPCELLRPNLKPTRQEPLALTVEQRSEFPKSDSGFRTTTAGKATMTAEKTEAEPEKLPQVSPTPGPSNSGTRTGPVVPETESTSPVPEVTTSPATGSQGPDSGQPDPGNDQSPTEQGSP